VATGHLRVLDSPGHAVLRAELRSGMGLPTPETLRSGFTEGLRRWKLRKSQAVEEPGYVSVRMQVAEPGDAGSEQEVFLSATALGTDTLLCASAPGHDRWTPSTICPTRGARRGQGASPPATPLERSASECFRVLLRGAKHSYGPQPPDITPLRRREAPRGP
jgi:hypothetical protein